MRNRDLNQLIIRACDPQTKSSERKYDFIWGMWVGAALILWAVTIAVVAL